MFGVLGVIWLAPSLFLEFIPDGAFAALEDPTNIGQRIFLAPQDLDFTPLSIREASPFLFFMLCSLEQSVQISKTSCPRDNVLVAWCNRAVAPYVEPRTQREGVEDDS